MSNRKKMLTLEQIRSAVTRQCKKYGIKKAYLFGSYANGQATENSDVDILFNAGSITTYSDYYNIHESLESELGTKVDLLTMDGINPRFFELIQDQRVPIYGA